MKTYESLLTTLASEGNWSLYDQLGNTTNWDEACERLDRHFALAVDHFDDDGASRIATYRLIAETDKQLLPFTEKVMEGGTIKLKLKSMTADVEIPARDRATVARARVAVELYKRLPEYKTRKERNYERDAFDKREFIEHHDPTLPKAKMTLLLEVANGWKSAANNQDADEFLAFLLKAPLHRDQEWKDDTEQRPNIRARVIRKVTDDRFPAHRIVRALSRISRIDENDRRTIGALVSCWQRNEKAEMIPHAFRLIEPFLRSFRVPTPNFSFTEEAANSPQIVEFSRTLNERLSLIDERVACLIGKIGKYGTTYVYDPDSDPRMPTVAITTTSKYRVEEDVHATFEQHKTAAEKWLKENSPRTFRVRLTHIGTKEYSSKDQVTRQVTL